MWGIEIVSNHKKATRAAQAVLRERKRLCANRVSCLLYIFDTVANIKLNSDDGVNIFYPLV